MPWILCIRNYIYSNPLISFSFFSISSVRLSKVSGLISTTPLALFKAFISEFKSLDLVIFITLFLSSIGSFLCSLSSLNRSLNS